MVKFILVEEIFQIISYLWVLLFDLFPWLDSMLKYFLLTQNLLFCNVLPGICNLHVS